MKKIFFVLIVTFLLSSPCLAQGEWEQTGSCNYGCEEFSTVTFDNSVVLKAGGIASSVELSYCEIRDPQTGEWTPTGPMNFPRSGKDFLIRISDTEVLATGQGGPDHSSEIYNLITGEWTLTGNMHFWHKDHTTEAFVNASGDTLFMVIGGDAVNDYKGCEVYDPETGEYTITGFLPSGKRLSPSIVLPNGNIMSAAGGVTTYDQCAIYDRITGEWTEIAPLNQGRLGATMELRDGSPMIINGLYNSIFLKSCEIYISTTDQWTFTDSLEIGRVGHCSEKLLNNKILAMAGQGAGTSCEIYDYLTNEWQIGASLNYGRTNFCSEILNNEKVLVIGPGICEIYTWNYQPIVSQPQGPNQGTIGDTLIFSITATDPDSDSIAVHIDQITEWTGLYPNGSTFEFSISWTELGIYQVSAQGADQWFFLNPLCHNSLSDWTEPLIVTIFGIPEIEVSVDSLNFGTVYIGQDSTETITISNLGNGILEAELLTDTDEFSVYPATFNLEPDESIDVEITFTPTYEAIITDTLTILSNDPENPEVKITLVGEGDILTPHIFISTDSLNFGTVFIGSDSLITLIVFNFGDGVLTATDIYTNTDEYSVNPSNFNLEPGHNQDIDVIFAPTYEGIITDTLTIMSNDPENPEIEIALVGEGEVPVSVDDNEILSNFIGNFPNPFNSTTTIYFNISRKDAKNAKLVIYNIKGQNIRILECINRVNAKTTRSFYSITWNGIDDNNKPVGNGIYFYTLKIGEKEIASNKMLLLK